MSPAAWHVPVPSLLGQQLPQIHPQRRHLALLTANRANHALLLPLEYDDKAEWGEAGLPVPALSSIDSGPLGPCASLTFQDTGTSRLQMPCNSLRTCASLNLPLSNVPVGRKHFSPNQSYINKLHFISLS